MTSYELKDNLNTFNTSIDDKISSYSSILSSMTQITNDINSVKGADSAMYDGVLQNNEIVTKSLNKIIKELESLKSSVNAKTNDEISRLKKQEDDAKKKKEEEEEGEDDE